MAESAKYMKAIAAYEQADVSQAVGTLDDDQQKVLTTLVKKVHNRLGRMNIEVVKQKERKSNISAVSNEQKLSAVIVQINKSLDRYESTDDIHEWKIDFTVGMKFDGKPSSAIESHHEQLVKAELATGGVKLLACMERGRLYDFLKHSESSVWEKQCSRLGICRRTADRYIDFSRITCAYPRLLICEISFAAVISLYRKLQEHLTRDVTLAHRLQLPLKQTTIKSDITFFSQDQDEIEVEDPPTELLCENADWQPGWRLTDEIIESRETEEEIWHEAQSDTSLAD